MPWRSLIVGLLSSCLLLSIAPRFGTSQNPEGRRRRSELRDSTRDVTRSPERQPDRAGDPPRYPADDPSRARAAAIRQALRRPASPQLEDQTLEEAVAWFAKELGIQIVPERAALLDGGISLDQRVSLRLTDVPAQSALRHLLDQYQLCCVVRNDVLIVVTSAYASEQTDTRVYEVSDLVLVKYANADPDLPTADFMELIDLVTSTLPTMRTNDSGEWEDNAGPGRIRQFQAEGINALVIRQTQLVHDEIAELLAELRRNRSDAPERRRLPRLRPDPSSLRPFGGGSGFGGSGNGASGSVGTP